MKFFLGIDGGGTRTRAFLAGESGQGVAWGEGGLGNPNHASPEQLVVNLREAIGRVFDQAALAPASCVSVFAGMAGITTEGGRQSMARTLAQCGLGHARITVDHDIRIALAGGLGGEPGIALIVGTGSSCYGRTATGKTWQTGGWEALISDEGSAYFVGRESIAMAARMADGRSPDSDLKMAVFTWLGINQIAEILPRVHEQGLSRVEIAAFAPRVVELAGKGDPRALDILDRGAFLLAELVAANHRMLPTSPGPDVVITGGLGTAPGVYREKIEAALQQQLPSIHIHQPKLTPAAGAAMLAMEQVGQFITPGVVERLGQYSVCSP